MSFFSWTVNRWRQWFRTPPFSVKFRPGGNPHVYVSRTTRAFRDKIKRKSIEWDQRGVKCPVDHRDQKHQPEIGGKEIKGPYGGTDPVAENVDVSPVLESIRQPPPKRREKYQHHGSDGREAADLETGEADMVAVQVEVGKEHAQYAEIQEKSAGQDTVQDQLKASFHGKAPLLVRARVKNSNYFYANPLFTREIMHDFQRKEKEYWSDGVMGFWNGQLRIDNWQWTTERINHSFSLLIIHCPLSTIH